jgi:curli biogenesis system outer membrane secretion channel CsgG
LLVFFAGCTKEPYIEPQATTDLQATTDPQVTTVAVWDVENLNPDQGPGFDMGALLSAKVIETLQESGSYQLVEREQLILTLKELDLGTTLLVDEDTRLRIGQICGARFMVFGSYVVHGELMRLNLRMVEVETGSLIKATEKTTSAGDLNNWPKIAGEAAQDLK